MKSVKPLPKMDDMMSIMNYYMKIDNTIEGVNLKVVSNMQK